jgi:hypothetical protein
VGNSYFTFLTFEAGNQTRGCKRNRQISYGPNKLRQLDQTSNLVSRFTCLFVYYLCILIGQGVGPEELGGPWVRADCA